MRAMLLLPLLLFGCAKEPTSPLVTTAAMVTIDLDAGRAVGTSEGHVAEATFDRTIAAALDSLFRVVATGEDDPELRRRVGETILAPLEPVLRDATRWTWRLTGAGPTPGPLATLAAWEIPWRAPDPVGAHHAILFDWPTGLRDQLPRPKTSTGGRLLLFAPFRPGFEPVADDPDTLRQALRRATAQVDLVPRNDVDASDLRRALESGDHGWLWVRALPDQLAPLRPAFGAAPGTVVWSLPAGLAESIPGVVPNAFASGGRAPGLLVVATWSVPELDLARFARTWIDGVARGLPADVALAGARREAWEAGRPIHTWTNLHAIGDPEASATLPAAPWLRRVSPGR